MIFSRILGLVCGCGVAGSVGGVAQWVPPNEIGADRIKSLSDQVLAMPDIPIREDMDITRIRALDLEWDIAGMVYQPKEATRIPTGPDGRKVGIFHPAWRLGRLPGP